MNFDEPMEPEKFERYVKMIDEYMRNDPTAGEETRELVRWFTKRYPTMIERCRYSTRKYRELAASTFGMRREDR